jgi:hypothetical protein
VLFGAQANPDAISAGAIAKLLLSMPNLERQSIEAAFKLEFP